VPINWRLAALTALFALLCTQLSAVEPDELLSDPLLEQRARQISQSLRCLVCPNESVDESNAPLAMDLRQIVRELLVEGRSDEEIYDFVEQRYGQFALLMPRGTAMNMPLFLSGPVLLLVAIALAWRFMLLQRRRTSAIDRDLDKSEVEQLESVMVSRPDSKRRR